MTPCTCQALGALHYLHTNDIAHRDLKLENFIFDTAEEDAELKLIDFGFSRQYLEGGDKMHDTVGTCYYLAPEVLGKDYTESSDLWSLGVVVYMMVTGECPFGGQANSEIIGNIKKQAKNPAAMHSYFQKRLAKMGVTDPAISFLLGLLTVDPEKRLTAAQALKHPWITDRTVARRRTIGPHTSAKEAQERGGAIIHQLKHFREQGNLKRAALMASNGNSPAYLLCICLLTENTDGAPLPLRPNTGESEHPINVVRSLSRHYDSSV